MNLPQERQSGYTSDDVPQTGCDCGGMWQVKESESAGAPANDHVLWDLEKLTGKYMMAPEKVSGNSNIVSVLSLLSPLSLSLSPLSLSLSLSSLSLSSLSLSLYGCAGLSDGGQQETC